jgi:aspartyl/asparaginyl-tRNA synthetase
MLNAAHKTGSLKQPFEYGNDFGSPDETWLSSQFDRPVMVHRYPANVKAFYMEPDPINPQPGSLRRRSGAGGLRRDHRRLAARVKL